VAIGLLLELRVISVREEPNLVFGELKPGLEYDGQTVSVVVACSLDADEDVAGAGEGRRGGGGDALHVILGQTAGRSLLPAHLHLIVWYLSIDGDISLVNK